MERSLWTDERIDDRFAMSDQRFEELIARMDRFEARMDRFETRLDDMQRQMVSFAVVQFAALLTILVTLIVRT